MSEEIFAFQHGAPPSEEFEITGARVMAALGCDRRVLLENVPRLVCGEGRLHTCRFHLDREHHTLDYNFSFGASDVAEVIPLTPHPARIIISGRYRSRNVEIKGAGWIGYDREANIGGYFDAPPAITIHNHWPEAVEPRQSEVRSSCTIIDFPPRRGATRTPVFEDLERGQHG